MNDVASAGADIQKTMLEALSEALGLAILVCDRNDEIVFASRPVLQFYPIPMQYLQPGTRLRDFLGAVFDSGMRTGTAPEKSRRRVNRDEWISEKISLHWRERYETVERVARHRWFSVRKRRLSNGLGIVAISDVSEQKKREEQVQLEMERTEVTENILDCLPNPVCVKDRSLNYIAVNKAFCAIHGVTADAILGRSAWDLLEPELAEKFERSDRATLETGKVYRLPEQIVQADGEDLWVVTRKFRVGAPDKYLIVTCMNDVTDVVIGYQDVPDGAGASPFQIKDFGVFEPGPNCFDPFRSLDMQQILEAGAIIDRAPPPSKRRILVLTSHAALEQGLVPQLRKWGFDACAVRDRSELIAFMQSALAGGLHIDALLIDAAVPEIRSVLSAWEAAPYLVVARDWKPGELHAGISALLDNRQVTPVPGEDHGDWEIVVSEAVPDPQQAPEIEVLVAEDNEINQFVFAQILEGLGISYRIAVNGEEAVRLWQQYRPYLVLMDVSMPVMNGFDAAKAIRAAEKTTGSQTPIVAVTAQALDIDLERSFAAGMNDHITKPISPDMIEAVYRKFVSAKTERLAG